VILKGQLEIAFSSRHQTQLDESNFKSIDDKGINEFIEIFSSKIIEWGDISFTTKIDWSHLKSVILESYDESGRFYMTHENTLYKQLTGLETVIIPIVLGISNTTKTEEVIFAFKKHLMDVFLISNLAVPGLVNFYNAKLIFKKDEKESLKLSSFYFEKSLENQFLPKVPFTKVYSVEQANSWYKHLDTGTVLIADSPIQKALYSLLHICKMDADISMVPWIFHALEAIYGTNAGRGFNDLSTRINFLLNIEERERKRLKSNLRNLNNLRSAFVHGGYRVSHPLEEDVSDDIFQLTEFGVVLIISSLQQMMHNRWFGLQAIESFIGVTKNIGK